MKWLKVFTPQFWKKARPHYGEALKNSWKRITLQVIIAFLSTFTVLVQAWREISLIVLTTAVMAAITEFCRELLSLEERPKRKRRKRRG